MPAITNDFGHFRRGDLLGYQNVPTDTGDLQFFRKTEPFPAALVSTLFAQTLAASAAIATWSAVTPTISAGAVTIAATPAVATWSGVTPTVTAGAVTIAASPATATWSVVAPSLTPGVRTLAASPATATWSVPTAVMVGQLVTTPATATWSVPGAAITGGARATVPRYTATIGGHVVLSGGDDSRFPDFVLPLRRGDDEAFEITITNVSDSVPVNLTAWSSFAFTIKRGIDDDDSQALLRLTSNPAAGLTRYDEPNGVLRAQVSGISTAVLPSWQRRFYADLEGVDPQGKRKTIIAGYVRFAPDVGIS